jgi:hypothetical protein
MITRGVIILHDACTVQDMLRSMRWKVLVHHPYSPNLSPWYFHVFSCFNKVLKSCGFGSDKDIKFAVVQSSSSPSCSLQRGSIGWYINGMPTSRHMGTIFHRICLRPEQSMNGFHFNKPHIYIYTYIYMCARARVCVCIYIYIYICTSTSTENF